MTYLKGGDQALMKWYIKVVLLEEGGGGGDKCCRRLGTSLRNTQASGGGDTPNLRRVTATPQGPTLVPEAAAVAANTKEEGGSG